MPWQPQLRPEAAVVTIGVAYFEDSLVGCAQLNVIDGHKIIGVQVPIDALQCLLEFAPGAEAITDCILATERTEPLHYQSVDPPFPLDKPRSFFHSSPC